MTTTRTGLLRTAISCALLTITAAGCSRTDARIEHPGEIAGTWVQRRADGTWGDTLQYLADGRVVGSAPGLRWSVVQSKAAGESLCTGAVNTRMHCQPFRLAGDTLVLGLADRATLLKRAR